MSGRTGNLLKSALASKGIQNSLTVYKGPFGKALYTVSNLFLFYCCVSESGKSRMWIRILLLFKVNYLYSCTYMFRWDLLITSH